MIGFVGRFLRRLQRARHRGLYSSLRSFAVRKFNRRFRARVFVWVWHAGEPLFGGSDDVQIARYVTASSVPNETLDELIAGDGESFLTRMREEFAVGAVLWVGSIDGRVAGYQWSQHGDSVSNWHFELIDRDVVIYSTVTFHEFRGRRVAGTMMAHICRKEVAPGGRATADCMVWNEPSKRFIERTGFRIVGERKPLAQHPD